MTTTKPSVSAVCGAIPSKASRCPTGPPRLAPEKAPATTPMPVIPTCTVERKRPGSEARSIAVCAPRDPFLAIALSRGLREDTIDSSAMANRPLRPTSSSRMTTSIQGKGVRCVSCMARVML